MSFSGNLEHISIVDVIQLLNSTKKTGTLYVTNDNFVYKFAFKEGSIVSVIHPDTTKSLIKIIRDKKILDDETIKSNMYTKKPLVAELIEKKLLDLDTVITLLQNLVELTVVDILTWSKGGFQLFVDRDEIDDNYQYISRFLKDRFFISTQNTLMESLRIFDEMRRDNLLDKGIFEHEIKESEYKEQEIEISEDILGLSDIDKIQRKVPSVFRGVDLEDFASIHRKKVISILPKIKKEQEERLISFLVSYSKTLVKEDLSKIAIIFFTKDELTSHVISTISRSLGIFIFITDNEENFCLIAKQSVKKNLVPLIIMDCNIDILESLLSLKKEIIKKFPMVRFIHFVEWNEQEKMLSLLSENTIAVFPRPLVSSDSFDKLINFYESVAGYLKNLRIYEFDEMEQIKNFILKAKDTTKISEIINLSLTLISSYFSQSAVFFVRKDGIYLENVVGFDVSNLPQKVVFSNLLYDKLIKKEIVDKSLSTQDSLCFLEIFGKHEDDFLIIPFVGAGRLLAFIYACSNKKMYFKELIDFFKISISSILDSIIYRKMFEKNKKSE